LGDSKPFQKISIETLFEPAAGKLVIEEAKCRVLEEFLDAIDGRVSKQGLRSSIEDHDIPTKLMSAIYASHVQRMRGQYPIVSCSFSDRPEVPLHWGWQSVSMAHVPACGSS
jgi:hypothetical protein